MRKQAFYLLLISFAIELISFIGTLLSFWLAIAVGYDSRLIRPQCALDGGTYYPGVA
jgi:ABC-type cobalamin transport system permease subunit